METNRLSIKILGFWLVVISVVLMIVAIVTTVRMSEKFDQMIDTTSRYAQETMEFSNLGEVHTLFKREKNGLADLQKDFYHQQIYLVVIIVLLLITFGTGYFLVVRPLCKFVHCIEVGEELPLVGSSEVYSLAARLNSLQQNTAASNLVLQHEAEHDALTGLFNRGAFEKMKKYLTDSLEPMALLLIDVDLFKKVNDTYGHDAGDKALIKVATLIKEQFRSSDLIFRVGGDEFAIIMPRITPSEKHVISHKIEEANRRLAIPDENVPMKLSLSVGIAFSQFGYGEELYTKTDKALYYTKEHGRCGYNFFNSQIEKENP